MRKNQGGMTLIEVVIAIAVLAIASLTMGVGFITANNMMNQSNIYTKIVKSEVAALNNSSQATDSTTISEKADEEMTFTANGKVLSRSGKVVTAADTRLDGKALKLTQFSADAASSSARSAETDNFYNQVKNLYITLNNINGNGNRLKYLWNTYQYVPLTNVNNFAGSMYVSNLTMQDMVYHTICEGTNFPVLNSSVIQKCDAIYDQTHAAQTNKYSAEYQAKLSRQSNNYYINIYWVDDATQSNTTLDNCLILYASPNSNVLDLNYSSLIYNAKDGCWYYKIFPSNGSDNGSEINVATYAATYGANTVSQLQSDLADTSKWVRIVN